tara:strand:- start:4830 stop:4982 length:153 start_codon:yes stop_codon:yes gene_type:complete
MIASVRGDTRALKPPSDTAGTLELAELLELVGATFLDMIQDLGCWLLGYR